MVNDILEQAGVKYRESRFMEKPLPETYAVYFDDREASGTDGANCLITHNITIEVYETKPDDITEAAIVVVAITRSRVPDGRSTAELT